MFRAILCGLSVVLLPGTVHPGPGQNEPELLRRWLIAIEDHRPGAADDWAEAIGDWAKPQLRSLVHAVDGGRVTPRARRRGAALHLDIAFLVNARATGNLLNVYPRNKPAPPIMTAEVVDGRQEGTGASLTHLEVARTLLAGLPPESQRDEFVRLWYEAAGAGLASRSNFAELTLHLQHARALFPDDPAILLESGCLHEVFAAPRSQAAARAAGGARLNLGSEQLNLSQAASYFRRALERRPDLTEARLHLGRVLGAQGKYEQAAAELRQVVDKPLDKTQLYFALVFFGRAQESLDRLGEARRAYESAATLFPGAQSPRMALSRLALERGDQREAERALEPLYAVTSDIADGFDPWWTYFTGQGRYADQKIGLLHAAMERDPK